MLDGTAVSIIKGLLSTTVNLFHIAVKELKERILFLFSLILVYHC
jgi:hypothetical protein